MKIFSYIINGINWVSVHMSELLLASVYVVSFLPFLFPGWHGAFFYGGLSGWLSFWAVFFMHAMTKEQARIKDDQMHLPYMFGIILIMAIIAIYILSGKKGNEPYSNKELFLWVYVTSLGGVMMGGFLWERVFKKNKKDATGH